MPHQVRDVSGWLGRGVATLACVHDVGAQDVFSARDDRIASVFDGVYCEINDVKLFAQNAEDCEKAGGKITHTVTTTVKPVEDKPKERSKN